MENFQEILRKVYLGIVVLFIALCRAHSTNMSYATVLFCARVAFTLSLLFYIPAMLFDELKHLFADKSVDELDKNLVIYAQTSEYEYRNAATVFKRLLNNIPGNKNVSGPDMPKHDTIQYETIVAEFLACEGILYTVRLEGVDEYIERRWNEESDKHTAEAKELVLEVFRRQFERIVTEGSDDILKNYYLGREIMAKKIIIGDEEDPSTTSNPDEALQPL